ncbi:unnamed protein product [Cuscuta europaea]|uniref:Uncharacterized protein n=1 Tax=Cuscuta europaea TaxID=41803 RepID=A0A9P0ZVJ9_CUSEU|nr:unnamed protein product [Cuscuta europaea]
MVAAAVRQTHMLLDARGNQAWRRRQWAGMRTALASRHGDGGIAQAWGRVRGGEHAWGLLQRVNMEMTEAHGDDGGNGYARKHGDGRGDVGGGCSLGQQETRGE